MRSSCRELTRSLWAESAERLQKLCKELTRSPWWRFTWNGRKQTTIETTSCLVAVNPRPYCFGTYQMSTWIWMVETKFISVGIDSSLGQWVNLLTTQRRGIEFCTLDSARLYRQFASWKLLQNWNLSLAKEFCHATSTDVNERLLRRRCGYKRCFYKQSWSSLNRNDQLLPERF